MLALTVPRNPPISYIARDLPLAKSKKSASMGWEEMQRWSDYCSSTKETGEN